MGMLVSPYQFGAGGGGGFPVGTLLETSTRPGSVPMPSYVAGDVVFVQILKVDAGGHAATTTPPAGWTLVSSLPTFSNTIHQMVYRRVMDGSEGSSVAFDWVTAGSVNAQAFAVSGVNTGGAITEAVATNNGTAPGSSGTVNLTAGAVTTAGTNRVILDFFGTGRGTNATLSDAGGAFTSIYTNATSLQSLNPHTAASKQVAAAAATYTAETRTETDSIGGIFWNTISFAVIMV